ncbi:MAG: DUF192 domain-containing protein [Rhizomicrobium sp.]
MVLAVLTTACVADPQPPPRPLPRTTLTIDANGRAVKFDVEVAGDWRSQEYGLMNRKYLAPKAGMLFDFHIPQSVSFWMEDTLIPLDMIFIKADGTISSIAPDAVPMSRASIPSLEPVRAVLEINGGEAAKLGIFPGQKVRTPAFDTRPATH